MADSDIDIAQCTASFRFEPHYESCPDRFFIIKGSAQHPSHGEVASLSGYLMTKRAAWKAARQFGSIMEAETQELSDFSMSIFDNSINVHPFLLDGGPRSGSGCWGEELNQGNIVYLGNLAVTDQFHGCGVGSWFLKQFLLSTRVNVAGSHVFCWPFPTNPYRVKPTLQVITGLSLFFQKNNFRRIGRTVFFCYSVNPSHPSRKLAIADDATAFSSDFPDMEQAISTMDSEHPLLRAIDTNRTAEIQDVITTAYALDPSVIHKRGPDGYMPVHLAAKIRNIHALHTLLDLGVTEDLKDTANIDGATPLQIIIEVMRRFKHYEHDVLDMWKEDRKGDVTCYRLLKNAEMPAMS